MKNGQELWEREADTLDAWGTEITKAPWHRHFLMAGHQNPEAMRLYSISHISLLKSALWQPPRLRQSEESSSLYGLQVRQGL